MERLTNRKTKLAKGGQEPSMIDVVHKLAEYEDLEEEGMLLKLTCKVGDTVYYIASDEEITYEMSIDFIKIFDECIHYHAKDSETSITFMKDDIGKTVFPTQEEAEAALQS